VATLQKVLRKAPDGLPNISTERIWVILQEAGFRWQKSRGWCETGPLRMLLIWDNLSGHHTPAMVIWLFQHGVMPLYTPLGGSWLNMAESIQRILLRRALEGQHPETLEQIIAWLEAVARGWNEDPTPFEWGGARVARRERSHARRHALAGSGACVRRSVRPKRDLLQKWHSTCQLNQ